MLGITTAERIEPLAAALATRLAEAPSDPFVPEWIAVPSAGMQRWLALDLARHLGASNPQLGDGVTANVTWAFPGSLRAAVVGSTAESPWQPDRLVWTILHVLETATEGSPLVGLGPDGDAPRRRYGRARRIADRFDRYDISRPEMIRAWAAGDDVDEFGSPLPEHQRWQPHLWRSVRAVLGCPSPAEALPAALLALAEGAQRLDLPPRLSVFGVGLLPGGAQFLPVADAVAQQHDLHLYLLEPSGVVSEAVRALPHPRHGRPIPRTEDRTADVVMHPLNRTWGRLHRETAGLLVDFEQVRLPPASAPQPTTLLGALQSDIRANRAPAGALRTAEHDRSVEFHACYGPARQVEVLRDAVLHALADDPTLTEDDILVVCPALEQFAPLLEAAFGPSAGATAHAPASGTPLLRYRIADRSLRAANPIADTFLSFVEVATGRVDAASVLDLCGRPAVRARFGFTSDDVGRIGDWVAQAGVRWGLDPAHREGFGLPGAVAGGSWQEMLDRLLLGVALADDGGAPVFGEIVPLDAEGDTARLAGRLADLVGLVADLARAANDERPLPDWITLLRAVLDDAFALDRDAQWQRDAVHRMLDTLEAAGTTAAHECVPISALDLRRVLEAYVSGFPGRPDYFRGGITVCSLTPLRWIPHRVVCILGFDHGAFGSSSPDGDDVTQPVLGDRDPRAEGRQALLETLLSAGERLIVLRDGHDVRTNQVVPETVPLAELRDALRATVHPDDRAGFDEQLTIEHPCRPQDERCFIPGALHPERSWSFDAHELDAATARRSRPAERTPTPWLRDPIEPLEATVVELAALKSFLAKPVSTFLRERIGVSLPKRAEEPPTALTVSLDNLEQWRLGDELLALRLTGEPSDTWRRRVVRLGTLPTGSLGTAVLDDLEAEVEQLLAAAVGAGVGGTARSTQDHAVELADGTRIEGTLAVLVGDQSSGTASAQFVRPKAVHDLDAWLDLALLSAVAPQRPWECIRVSRGAKAGAAPLVRRYRLVDDGDPARTGRKILECALRCLRAGMREPLPLFPKLSEALVRQPGPAVAEAWRGGNDQSGSHGDGAEPEHRFTYGDYEYEDLCAIEAVPGDPGDSGSRLERWAHYLWDTVASTLVVEEVTQ